VALQFTIKKVSEGKKKNYENSNISTIAKISSSKKSPQKETKILQDIRTL
jgi:hypothetical protein